MSAGTCFKGRSSSTLAAYGTNQPIKINEPASFFHGDFTDKVLAARFDRVPVLNSVVIPTLGRASLNGAIESAVKQSVPVFKILVINDSGATLDAAGCLTKAGPERRPGSATRVRPAFRESHP